MALEALRGRWSMERVALALIALGAVIATYAGWRAFWFLTDDAFIAFRYASNSLLGRGYVWNPAPFVPVEGYTSFLWMFLLRHVWSLTGIEPPVAANWLALACGYITLALGARMLWQMELPERTARWRVVWLALVLIATIGNRTFLTWLSSGLETSLFNCALTYWVFAVTRARGGARLWHLALSCALVALTRPDGLLFAGASLPLIADELARASKANVARRLLACTPLIAIPAHLAFRVSTYGEWVPNTYFAKVVQSWPAAGKRYVLSFALEYGTWLWTLCALAWLVLACVRLVRAQPRPALHEAGLGVYRAAPLLIAVAALCMHAGYYVFVVGGDHFEYRIFSHLPLLLALALVWLLAQLSDKPALIALVFALYIGTGTPIPWVHYQRTHALTLEDFHHRWRVKIADAFPEPLRAPVELWDETQHWLINHAVGSRWMEHKLFFERMLKHAPSRAKGSEVTWAERPVHSAPSVGVVGYVLPNVALIDQHGLNDRVIARTPPPKHSFRKMAHERLAPPGYMECFKPDLIVYKGRIKWTRRMKPLTDEEIVKCDSLERWVKAKK